MNIQDSSATEMPNVFKYKWNEIIFFATLMLITLCLYALFISIKRGDETIGGLLFIGVMLLWLIVGSGIFLMGRSNILVDDKGISRRLWGKTWQHIEWGNIKLITAFPVLPLGQKSTQRSYNIYPAVKPFYIFTPGGKIFFDEKIEDAPKLIELLNFYILQYNIKVEIKNKPNEELFAVKTLPI